jgi:hypothetical protein
MPPPHSACQSSPPTAPNWPAWPQARRPQRPGPPCSARCKPCCKHALPVPLLDDLLSAFIQDVEKTRDAPGVRPAKSRRLGQQLLLRLLFLPAPRRAAITAFYAFCREVDDVVDEVTDPGVARTKLAWWQAEVAKAFAGQPTHPVMQALMPHTADYGIEQRHLQAVIDGCQMDLEQTRYLDFAGLQRYCHLVAGIVGEVAARIFGQTDPHHPIRPHAGPGVSAHQHHPRRGRRRHARPHLPAGERAAAV